MGVLSHMNWRKNLYAITIVNKDFTIVNIKMDFE